jgi:signal transduction histidine kinase
LKLLSSLQSRIAFFHLLAMAIAAILVPLSNYLVINKYANQFEARTLRDHATIISQYISKTPAGWQLNLPPDIKSLYAHGLDGLSYAVADDGGRTLISSGQAADARLVSDTAEKLRKYSDGGIVFYGLAIRHGVAPDTVWIRVAQNIQHPDVIFDDIVAGYLGQIGWFTVAILALLLAVDIVVIRKALAPVLRSSRVASAIDPRRTDLRLSETGLPSELLPLIVAMNQALDRLDKGIKLQREFTADAAHELRTPLAVLRARLDMMPDQLAVGPVKADLEVMSHVVNQLMEIAEIESTGIALAGRVDLSAVSENVVAMLAEMTVRQGKDIALLGAEKPVLVKGDANTIFRAISNLVDNAIKYTAPGSTVELEVRPNGSVLVSDRGPGISEEEHELIFRRFWRADRNLATGSGLGLAIVSRIAEIHYGAITVANRPEGGAVFTLFIPPIL